MIIFILAGSGIANFRSRSYLLSVSPAFVDADVFSRYSGSSLHEVLNRDIHLSQLARSPGKAGLFFEEHAEAPSPRLFVR